MKIIPQHNILNKLYLFQNLQEYRTDEYPDNIFYYKNDKIYFDLNIKNSVLWCNYERVWSVFSEQESLDYFETQRVIKNVVEKHTNWGVVTPSVKLYSLSIWWKNIQIGGQ